MYHVLLYNMADRSVVTVLGAMHTKPGIFRVSRWFPGFNFSNYKQTAVQVWIRIFELPLEYRKTQNLLNITRGVGLPWKIDRQTLNLSQGIYARILVEVDLVNPLPERLLVTRRDKEGNVMEDFFLSQ